MVDFSKRLAKPNLGKKIDPIELYDTLDRASDKGELRTAQREILTEWHQTQRNSKDLIVKLHTGQGKTLIGLLMLQSKLNEGCGPALYICPNNFLIEQTCLQAKQFGIRVTTPPDGEIPSEFLNMEVILVTSVQKLFNGLTKFGLGPKSLPVGTLLMDDAHACIDSIRDAFSLRIPRDHASYQHIIELFASELENQGAGTFADIQADTGNDVLPIPYWSWKDKASDLVKILAKTSNTAEVKFTWQLLKDRLTECQCVVSAKCIEIAPFIPPLDLFGSYSRAKHRIFMSATVTDDSFLVRGLRLNSTVIKAPLTFRAEKWSGEKMILLPSLISEKLTRSEIVKEFGIQKRPSYGIVALTRSFAASQDWSKYGATIADTDTINKEVERLRNGSFEKMLVIVNRYDGIDLPDDTCRILIVDSKPYAENLIDRYIESCRSSSDAIALRVARTIEQGLGRSVRGEKDYCVIVIIGGDVIASVRGAKDRKYLSDQTQAQVDIGLEIAEMAKEDWGSTTIPHEGFRKLISQCLKRDPSWKEFYKERMDAVVPSNSDRGILEIFEKELKAEVAFQNGDPQKAVKEIQSLIDSGVFDDEDKAWYLQEMARYTYAFDKAYSNSLQVQAHCLNRFLLKPRSGMKVDKIKISQQRIERIQDWLKKFPDQGEFRIQTEDMLQRLCFGVRAERFEHALDQLGKALGFECQRPDKQWGQGPDNLWGLKDGEYLLFECKSEVHLNRSEINKTETGQMNNAMAWFGRNYPGAKSSRIMIIPTNRISVAAGFNDAVEVMRSKELGRLVSNARSFFNELSLLDPGSISEKKIQDLLDLHCLSEKDLAENYSTKPRETIDSDL